MTEKTRAISAENVLGILSRTEGKDSFTICKELEQLCEKHGRASQILRELVREGWARRQEDYSDAERVRRRGGRPVFLYYLSEEGMRHRHEHRKNEVPGGLVPQEN